MDPSTDLPWLMSDGAFAAPEKLAARTIPRLAESVPLLRQPSAPDAILQGARTARQCGVLEPWSAALAREILITASADPAAALRALEQCESAGFELRPFPDGPPVGNFLASPTAAALIPLESASGSVSEFAQLWMFDENAWPHARARLAAALREGTQPDRSGRVTHLILPPGIRSVIQGRSWELAAAVLDRILAAKPQTILSLAKDWIITGSIDPASGETLPVRFQGKPALARLAPARRWLIPAANQASVPPGWEAATGGRLYYALDIHSALAQITGEGFANGNELSWSQSPLNRAAEFHLFASHALGPMLAPILWTQPERVVIWASKVMEPVAEQLRQACLDLRPKHLRRIARDDAVQIRPIHDTDLTVIRETLLNHRSLGAAGPEPLLFNITGGNLLMRVALLDLARLRPNLWLVYRPESKKDLGYAAISHPFHKPVVCKIHLEPEAPHGKRPWSDLVNLNFALEKVPQERWGATLIRIARDILSSANS